MATLLADSPPAPSDEPKAPDALDGAPQAPSNGAAPVSQTAPALPSEPMPAAHACARCSAPMAPGQDWCLQCGAGAPGSIGTPGWRSAATLLTITAVLAVGAAAAAYAALSKHTPATHVVTATVAQAAPPATTVPQTTTPFGTATPTQPLIHAKVKPPKIPLVASKIPQQTTTTPTNTTGSKTTTTPTNNNNDGGGTEPKPTAIVLDTNAASTYNPYNYPAGDFGDPSLAIDGDTSTAWDAQVEPAKAPNMAEGLLVDLKSKEKLGALNLVTSTPGMVVQVYGTNSQTAPTSITDTAWVPLSHARALKKKHAHIVLKDSTKAFAFITVWISKAPLSSTAEAPGHVSVNELELFPAE